MSVPSSRQDLPDAVKEHHQGQGVSAVHGGIARRSDPRAMSTSFDYLAVGGSNYDVDYVKKRVTEVPLQPDKGGDALLSWPAKSSDNTEVLYAWPKAGVKSTNDGRKHRSNTAGTTAGATNASPARAPQDKLPTLRKESSPACQLHARQLITGLHVKAAAAGMWQNVPKNEWDLDRPAMRADIEATAYGFRLAMAVLDADSAGSTHKGPELGVASPQRGGTEEHSRHRQHKPKNRGPEVDAEGKDAVAENTFRSSLENDLLVIKAQISHAFAERRTLSGLLTAAQFIDEAPSPVISAQADVEERALVADVRESIRWNEGEWNEAKGVLSGCVYEQKWTDLSIEQLTNQLGVTCREHGDMLRQVRCRYASIFNKITKLYSDSLWMVDKAVGGLMETKKKLNEAELRWDDRYRQLEASLAELKEEMAAQEAINLDKRESIQQEARDQVKRMGETLRTLNGIFRNMQSDVEAMRAADTKDQMELLRAELHEKKVELTELRPVAETVRLTETKLAAAEKELKRSQEAVHILKVELKKRDSLIQDLMVAKSETMAQQDRAEAEAKTKAKEGADVDDRKPKVIAPTSVLCARCNQALDEVIHIDEPQEVKRQQCYAFRLMMPNNSGRVPERTVKWTRQCMRAIIYHKVVEVAMLGSTQQCAARFPEFVYAYFEPSRKRLEGVSRDEKFQFLERANEDRWGLYYGVKALARENAEARLFWTFLDETYGSDYLAFYLHALNLVENIAGAPLRLQFGKLPDRGATYESLEPALQEQQQEAQLPFMSEEARLAAEKLCGGQESVYVELKHVKAAIDILLEKASKESAIKLWEATRGLAVSSLNRVPVLHDRDNDEGCVELYVWLKLFMQHYRQDQINRRAAIKLMFSTSLSGVMTSDLEYDPGRPRTRTSDEEKHITLNLPQTLAIVRTLWPQMSMSEGVALYRDIHASGEGKVDLDNFLKICEQNQLFARSLQLAPIAMAKVDRKLGRKEHLQLDSAVHMHHAAMRPYLERLKAMLPERARANFEVAELSVKTALAMRSKASLAEVDGLCSIFAYRRLLLEAQRLRMLMYETCPDYTGLLSCMKFEGYKLVVMVRKELELVECAMLDGCDDHHLLLFDLVRRKVAVHRIQRIWRHRLREAMLIGVPLSVTRYMSRGYCLGTSEIRARRQTLLTTHVEATMSEIYTRKLKTDLQRASLGIEEPPFPQTIYELFLSLHGCRSVADRALHDFFHNARKLATSHMRIRLLGMFVGMFDADKEIKHFHLLQSNEAVNFYLRAVILIRAEMGTPPEQLFPVTYVDKKGRMVWEVPSSTLELVLIALFKHMLGSNSLEFLNVVSETQAIDSGSANAVDVDEFLWIVMKHYALMLHNRFTKARLVITSSAAHPSRHVLSLQHFQKLENEIFVNFPEDVDQGTTSEDVDQGTRDLVTSTGFLKASGQVDRKPNNDPTELIVAALRPRLLADSKLPLFTVTPSVHVGLESTAFLREQRQVVWASYESPIREYLSSLSARRTSAIDAAALRSVAGPAPRRPSSNGPALSSQQPQDTPMYNALDMLQAYNLLNEIQGDTERLTLHVQYPVTASHGDLSARGNGRGSVLAKTPPRSEDKLWSNIRALFAVVLEINASLANATTSLEFLPDDRK